jgi:hypothetical protein
MRTSPDWRDGMIALFDEFMKTMDSMPLHFWLHMMHAIQIMGAHHSDPHIRDWWHYCYCRMVHAMHVWPETSAELNKRLGDNIDGWRARSDQAITK